MITFMYFVWLPIEAALPIFKFNVLLKLFFLGGGKELIKQRRLQSVPNKELSKIACLINILSVVQ